MGRDQHPWQGAEREESFPHSEKAPHSREHSWDRGNFRVSKGNEATGQWKAGQSKICMHGPCCSPAHPSLSCVSPGVEGVWVLESGVWRLDPGSGQLLAVKRQPEGTGVRNSMTRKFCGRSLGHHRNKAPLLSSVQGVGLPLHPLSPPTGPCFHRHWKGCPSEQAHPRLKPRTPRPAQALGTYAPCLPKPPWESALGTPA